MKEDILKKNKNGWDKIAPHFFGITALPEYGPLIATEDELKLFGNIQKKKVLDIGCGSGHSLEYMACQGAGELWGIDLSSTQIETARDYLEGKNLHVNLFSAPMEREIDLPKNYFDIVYSIYALGWTTDLKHTLELIYSYLKDGGIFVFSWDHPMYQCIRNNEDEIIIEKSYLEEGFESIEKIGESVCINRIKISTYINELAKVGFKVDQLIEGDLSEKYTNEGAIYSGKYYTLQKAIKVPSSFVIKARKLSAE